MGAGTKVSGELSSETRKTWQRARTWLRRAAELWPLTLRGVGVAASAALALWAYGFRALDGVWYVAGLGLLALGGFSLVSVLLCVARVKWWLARQQPAAELLAAETRRPFQTGFRVPRLRFWLFADLHVDWLTPPLARVNGVPDGALLGEEVRLFDHGELRSVLRRVVVRDVFGLASVSLRKRSAIELDVLPHAGALRSLPLLRSLAGGDDIPHPMGLAQGDRLELRRYAPGDPARFIHWKAYARTHKLVVRMPERALARAHRVAAYLVAGPGDRASAAAARVALEEGALGTDFRFGADGAPEPVERLDAALSAIRRSSAARAQPAAGLSAFVAAVEREGPAALVFFVPPQLGGAVERIGDVVKRRALPTRVVIGIDGLLQEEPDSWLVRMALAREPTERIPVAMLREVMAAYRRHGCDVVVLDRESGRVLGEAHLDHALQAGRAQGKAA